MLRIIITFLMLFSTSTNFYSKDGNIFEFIDINSKSYDKHEGHFIFITPGASCVGCNNLKLDMIFDQIKSYDENINKWLVLTGLAEIEVNHLAKKYFKNQNVLADPENVLKNKFVTFEKAMILTNSLGNVLFIEQFKDYSYLNFNEYKITSVFDIDEPEIPIMFAVSCELIDDKLYIVDGQNSSLTTVDFKNNKTISQIDDFSYIDKHPDIAKSGLTKVINVSNKPYLVLKEANVIIDTVNGKIYDKINYRPTVFKLTDDTLKKVKMLKYPNYAVMGSTVEHCDSSFIIQILKIKKNLNIDTTNYLFAIDPIGQELKSYFIEYSKFYPKNAKRSDFSGILRKNIANEFIYIDQVGNDFFSFKCIERNVSNPKPIEPMMKLRQVFDSTGKYTEEHSYIPGNSYVADLIVHDDFFYVLIHDWNREINCIDRVTIQKYSFDGNFINQSIVDLDHSSDQLLSIGFVNNTQNKLILLTKWNNKRWQVITLNKG